MTYTTFEAYIQDNKILPSNLNFSSKNKIKVLITVLDQDNELDIDFRELSDSEITQEIKNKIKSSKTKPITEFISLSM